MHTSMAIGTLLSPPSELEDRHAIFLGLYGQRISTSFLVWYSEHAHYLPSLLTEELVHFLAKNRLPNHSDAKILLSATEKHAKAIRSSVTKDRTKYARAQNDA